MIQRTIIIAPKLVRKKVRTASVGEPGPLRQVASHYPDAFESMRGLLKDSKPILRTSRHFLDQIFD
jgi:hypothetical protein